MANKSTQSEATATNESSATRRVINNELLRMGLFGMFPLADPFDSAARSASSSGGLLGKLPPRSLSRVEAFVGRPRSEWTASDVNRALELMGFWVDSLAERAELQYTLLVAQRAPKKRGRKPKRLPKLGPGLLGAPTISKGGRPITWDRSAQEGMVKKIDTIKAEFSLKHDSKAIQKLIELWANYEGISPRSLKQRHQRNEGCSLEGTLRNLVSRGRKSLSKPPPKLP